MQIRSWHLALLGLLCIYVYLPIFFSSYVDRSVITGIGAMFFSYILVNVIAIAIILLWGDKRKNTFTVFLLWFVIALALSFLFNGVVILFMYPPYLIVFLSAALLMIWNYQRQEKGAVLSIIIGIFIAYLAINQFIFADSLGLIIASVLSALFFLSAGFFFLLKENKEHGSDAILK